LIAACACFRRTLVFNSMLPGIHFNICLAVCLYSIPHLYNRRRFQGAEQCRLRQHGVPHYGACSQPAWCLIRVPHLYRQRQRHVGTAAVAASDIGRSESPFPTSRRPLLLAYQAWPRRRESRIVGLHCS